MRSQQIECSFIEMKNNKIQNQKPEGRFSLRLNLPQLRRYTSWIRVISATPLLVTNTKIIE
jgi:hypothetical protein